MTMGYGKDWLGSIDEDGTLHVYNSPSREEALANHPLQEEKHPLQHRCQAFPIGIDK